MGHTFQNKKIKNKKTANHPFFTTTETTSTWVPPVVRPTVPTL